MIERVLSVQPFLSSVAVTTAWMRAATSGSCNRKMLRRGSADTFCGSPPTVPKVLPHSLQRSLTVIPLVSYHRDIPVSSAEPPEWDSTTENGDGPASPTGPSAYHVQRRFAGYSSTPNNALLPASAFKRSRRLSARFLSISTAPALSSAILLRASIHAAL